MDASTDESAKGLPLTGIRVIELASVWAMPGAAMYLADQGADVIKVEPLDGDIGRVITMSPPINGLSRAFWGLNRNKRGVAVDLKSPDGVALVKELALGADVLIHNFRLGVDTRLGIDYETLAKDNPKLIYAAYNAFGQKGPKRNARGYDLVVQASAAISSRRKGDDGSPQPIGIFAVDMASSIMAGYAIMLALFQRERTGRGQKVTGSLLQTGLALQVPDAVRVADFEEPIVDTNAPRPAPYSPYICEDGRYVQLAVASEAEWQSLCKAIERPDLAAEPKYEGSTNRVENSDELRATLAPIFLTRSAAEWERRFDESDAPAVAVETPDSIFDADQARANDAFVEVEQPGVGTTTIVGVPFELSDAGKRPFTPAPGLGEHTDDVLGELGLSDERIRALRERGAIR